MMLSKLQLDDQQHDRCRHHAADENSEPELGRFPERRGGAGRRQRATQSELGSALARVALELGVAQLERVELLFHDRHSQFGELQGSVPGTVHEDAVVRCFFPAVQRHVLECFPRGWVGVELRRDDAVDREFPVEVEHVRTGHARDSEPTVNEQRKHRVVRIIPRNNGQPRKDR